MSTSPTSSQEEANTKEQVLEVSATRLRREVRALVKSARACQTSCARSCSRTLQHILAALQESARKNSTPQGPGEHQR